MSAVPETVETTDVKAGETSEDSGATDATTVGARAGETNGETTVGVATNKAPTIGPAQVAAT